MRSRILVPNRDDENFRLAVFCDLLEDRPPRRLDRRSVLSRDHDEVFTLLIEITRINNIWAFEPISRIVLFAKIINRTRVHWRTLAATFGSANQIVLSFPRCMLGTV